jgi:hypothetical protein
MTTLAPCPHCNRHIRANEATCPFCIQAVASRRAQYVPTLGRVSRAAVFSAALVACSKDEPKPPPPTPPAQGSDDLEKLLDHQPQVAAQPDAAAPADAGVDAAMDAGLVDAGMPDAGVRVQKKKKKRDPANLEDTQLTPDKLDPRHMAKPYGAPPARRRVV